MTNLSKFTQSYTGRKEGPGDQFCNSDLHSGSSNPDYLNVDNFTSNAGAC